MSLTKHEKETIIVFNEAEKSANVYTHNKSLMKKLSEYCSEYPDKFTLETQDDDSKSFIIPKQYISIKKPRILSEYHKKNLQERMRLISAKNRVLA